MKELMQQTINFPKELLFISRNMNLVRSLNKFYGGHVDRIAIMAKTAYIGSKVETHEHKERGLLYWWSGFVFGVRVYILEAFNWFVLKTSGKTIDDYLEDEQIKHSK